MSAFFSQIMKGNKALWVIYIALVILSCVVTFSAMSRFTVGGSSVSEPLLRHITHLILGFAIIILLQILSFKTINLGSIPFLLGAAVLLVIGSIGGGDSGTGAGRFSAFGMPSDYVKLGLILVLSHVIMQIRRCEEFPKLLFWATMIVVGTLLMFIFKENLSSAVLIASVVFVMMLAGQVSLKRMVIIMLVAIGIVGASIAMAFRIPENDFAAFKQKHPAVSFVERAYTWKARVQRFGEKDDNTGKIVITDNNRQEVYAKVAVCRGGWVPRGLGSSLQRNYLPEAYSDYVFAIAVEEWGFPMGILIIALYLSLFGISVYYIYKEKKVYRKMLLLGCSFAITLQAAVHIAVSVGAIPVTGQTLPLISWGGSSIIVVSAMFGLIIKITALQSKENLPLVLKDGTGSEPAEIPAAEPQATESGKEMANETENKQTVQAQTDNKGKEQEKEHYDGENVMIEDEVTVADTEDDDDSIFIIEE